MAVLRDIHTYRFDYRARLYCMNRLVYTSTVKYSIEFPSINCDFRNLFDDMFEAIMTDYQVALEDGYPEIVRSIPEIEPILQQWENGEILDVKLTGLKMISGDYNFCFKIGETLMELLVRQNNKIENFNWLFSLD